MNDKPSDSNELVVTARIPARRDEVFEALSDPKIMEKWFVLDAKWTATTANDFREGGSYRHVMTTETGQEHEFTGKYLKIERPKRLVFTWTTALVKDTVVEVQLEEVGGETEVRIVHRFLPDEDARNHHQAGWAGCLKNFHRYFGAK